MMFFRKILTLSLLIAMQLVNAVIGFGQGSNFRLKDGYMIITINKNWSQEDCDSTMDRLDLAKINLDSLIRQNVLGELGKEGWKLRRHSKNADILELYKPVSELDGTFKKSIHTDLLPEAPSPTGLNVGFGRNKSSFTHISEEANGSTTIELKGYTDAKRVMLSGNFNHWSTMKTPMQKTRDGWKININLPYGKILYKFIVDGKWMHDPLNLQLEPNGTAGLNSVYFRTNHTFFLQGYRQARQVILAGSFNNWNEQEFHLIKGENGWSLPVYLIEGIHTYKYIIDGKWILDPLNQNSSPDGNGNTNSVLIIGHQTKFNLAGYPKASKVSVCGDFNNWNPEEIQLKYNGAQWVAEHILPRGKHEYKFVVDGHWMTDPANSCTIGRGAEKNSVLFVKPNHCFTLSGFPNARSVIVTGTFTDWDTSGFTMHRNGNKWELSIYLPPGKLLYKFIVDGEWMIDPANPHWEQNEHNTGNSVLWVEGV